MKEVTLNVCIGLVCAALCLLLCEAFSLNLCQELDDATVLSVEEGRQGVWGDESRTWVRFSDGVGACKSGRLGTVGEKIRAWRTTGCSSMLGWLGGVSMREARRRERASMRLGDEVKEVAE